MGKRLVPSFALVALLSLRLAAAAPEPTPAPARDLDIICRGPDGAPVPAARVNTAMFPRLKHDGRADEQGRLTIRSVALGKAIALYATSPDMKLAAYATVKVDAYTPRAVDLTFRPAATVTIRMVDPDGKPLHGTVRCLLITHAGSFPSVLLASSVNIPAETAVDGAPLSGLLPGVDYSLSPNFGSVTIYAGGGIRRFKEGAPPDEVVMKVERHDKPEVRPLTQADHDRAIAALSDVRWQKQDTVEPNLTWIAFARGIALSDAQQKTVRPFTDLLDLRDLRAEAIAFAPDKVWLGTNRGLLAYDRKLAAWGLVAVDGRHAAAVTALDLRGDVLRVTLAGDPPTKLDHDTKAGTWTPAKGDGE